ncbi:calcium/sodium antiporter [candidate division KSB1 bacterium]|nr:calcium/sodium antiporter [candidate division KSB1 bacterium]
MTLLWIAIFIVSLAVLVKASNYFTDAAEKVGLSIGIPKFVVGVTIVGIGTSLPELVSSIVAVVSGSSEIVVGNVVGSNITNIFLILGITAIVARKITINYSLVHVDLPLLIGSAFFLAVTMWDGVFTIPEAVLSVSGAILYLVYSIRNGREMHEDIDRPALHWYTWVILGASCLFIYIGAKYTVVSIIKISDLWGLGKEVVAASAVALGTSLPELAVTITAARKNQSDMAIGNILGSNIFNAFAVTGVSAFFGNLIIPHSIITFALPMMIIATLLYLFSTQDKQITRWEGWMMIMFYVLYLGKLFRVF